MRAPARCYPRLAGLTRTARSLDPGATYARRDSNPHQLGPQPSPSTRLRHERAEPLPGVAGVEPTLTASTCHAGTGVAGEPGLEPGRAWPSPGSEPGVLPVTPFPTAWPQLRPAKVSVCVWQFGHRNWRFSGRYPVLIGDSLQSRVRLRSRRDTDYPQHLAATRSG
jgi:hypothetical protein